VQTAGGGAAGAVSSLSVSVDGISGCRFTWQLADAGAEVISVDTGGIFHFESASSRLLEGYSSPEASATITRVTLIAHSSQVEEASAGATIISYAGSTKKDATTVTWENVSGTVSATGTVAAVDGKKVVVEGEELMARCIQHECDHLDGHIYIDRLDRPTRKKALRDIRAAGF